MQEKNPQSYVFLDCKNLMSVIVFYNEASQNSQIEIYLPIVKDLYIKFFVIHHTGILPRPRPGHELTTSGFILSTHYQQNKYSG